MKILLNNTKQKYSIITGTKYIKTKPAPTLKSKRFRFKRIGIFVLVQTLRP